MTKYHAKPTVYNGVRYASKREAAYAIELDARLRAKNKKDRILAWSSQPKFPMVVEGVKVCTYIADFLVSNADGTKVVIDVKGVQTPAFRIKAKLYEALRGREKWPPLLIVK